MNTNEHPGCVLALITAGKEERLKMSNIAYDNAVYFWEDPLGIEENRVHARRARPQNISVVIISNIDCFGRPYTSTIGSMMQYGWIWLECSQLSGRQPEVEKLG